MVFGGGSCPGTQPSSTFSLTDRDSQFVTLGPGSFTVKEATASGFTPSFSGDCMQTAAGSGEQLVQ